MRDTKNLYYKYDLSTDLLCLIVFVLGIYSYRQSSIEIVYEPEKEIAESVNHPSPADDLVLLKVNAALEKEQLYLNPELTLAELARHINLPAKTVSANINAAFDKTFNTYINTFRVAEVKRRLEGTDLEKLTLLGIAYESGFNSKTSFNRTFKEFTGVSPSDYLKK